MSPYISFRDKDKNGELQYYVLQREFPHYVGLLCYHPKDRVLASAPIAGYNLYVVVIETLRGVFIPAQTGVEREMQSVCESMAIWFWSERIAMDEKKYKKFKITSNAAST